MKRYEAPDAQVISFANDYVATGDASTNGLLHVLGGSCNWSSGDPILFDCGVSTYSYSSDS